MNLFRDNFFRQLVSRAIRTDYLENVTGFAWLFVQPLLLLAIYTFVFTTIFKARVADAPEIGFMPYLAVAFWPWTAFSESVMRASNSISANAALIGKVAIPVEMIPLSTVTATFLMHMVGYLAVLVAVQLFGTSLHWLGLLPALLLLLLMYLFACALALFLSTLQVFIRDVSQILPPLMTIWFFGTPILYGMSMLPPGVAALMKYNPMTWFVERLRDFLLFGDYDLSRSDIAVPLGTLLLLWLAFRFFRRFGNHFEDFL